MTREVEDKEPGNEVARNWREAEKLATDKASLTRSAEYIFPTDYPLHYLPYYHFRGLEYVWLLRIGLKAVKSIFLGSNDVTKTAKYCSKCRQRCPILSFF